MRTLMVRSGGFVCVLIGLIALMEVGLRLYYYGSLSPFPGGPYLYKPDRELGAVFNPDMKSAQQRLGYIVPVNTNSLGLRSPEIGPKNGRFRIAVIGDSNIAGSGLLENETLPAQLQSALDEHLGPGKFEVINAGGPSFNTVQELIQLRRLAGKIQADLVILGFNLENDIHYNISKLRRSMRRNPRRPVASLDASGALAFDYSGPEQYFKHHKWRLEQPLHGRPWYENTVTYLRGKRIWRSFGAKSAGDPNIALGRPLLSEFSTLHAAPGFSIAQYEKLWDEGWNVTKALVLAMNETSRTNGAAFAMTVVPAIIQVSRQQEAKFLTRYPGIKLDLTRINREMAAFGAGNAIPVLDLLTPLIQARDGGEAGSFNTVHDSHLRPKGHRILAQSLAGQLISRKLLPGQ